MIDVYVDDVDVEETYGIGDTILEELSYTYIYSCINRLKIQSKESDSEDVMSSKMYAHNILK